MTMVQMNAYLEARGYNASHMYVASEKKYRFTISKGDIHLVRWFVYPDPRGFTPAARDHMQRDFLENLMREFNIIEKGEKKEMNMTDIMALAGNPTGTLEVDGRRFPVVISQVESTHDVTGRNETQVICDVQSLYSPSKVAFYNVRKDTPFAIRKVVFNNPATIVLWMDGTKTVVKAGKGEAYDAEKGLAMAITKKALGNKGNYYDVIRKWVDDYTDKLMVEALLALDESVDSLQETLKKLRGGTK